MKLIFTFLAGLVVVTSIMYAVIRIVIMAEIIDGIIIGGIGFGILLGHLHFTDPPNFFEESSEKKDL